MRAVRTRSSSSHRRDPVATAPPTRVRRWCMPRFEAFHGLRYAPATAPLERLIAPPYDVVDADERARLTARSPYNSIRLELPAADPGRGLDRYRAAAALLGSWRAAGVLVPDPNPSLYVYKMRFLDDAGGARSTTGVIGALGLEPFGGAVVPHEQTMAAPGRDRLDLLRACEVNFSPIWGLLLASGLSTACAAASAVAGEHLVAVDDESTTHEMWRVDDEDAIRAITDLVAPAAVVIADGHHRHETAIRYRAECVARHDGPPGSGSVMAYVAELAPDELSVQAIHRLVTGLPDGFDLFGVFGGGSGSSGRATTRRHSPPRWWRAAPRRSCSPPAAGSFSRPPGRWRSTTSTRAGSTRPSAGCPTTRPTTSTARRGRSTPCATAGHRLPCSSGRRRSTSSLPRCAPACGCRRNRHTSTPSRVPGSSSGPSPSRPAGG